MQIIEYKNVNNANVKYGACSPSACFRVVLHFIFVLALEYYDPKQDGVLNICACVV